MRLTLSILVLALTVFSFGANAQEDASADDNMERRLELAKKIQDARPAREQIDAAVDQYVSRVPPAQREKMRAILQSALNYKALEKISVDAYAEIYNEAELQAMYEYYAKPESKTAADKQRQYAERVYPEIIRMLDRAMMRLKTGAGTP